MPLITFWWARESHWASGQMPYGRSRGQSWKNESFHQIEWLIIIIICLSWFADGPNWRPFRKETRARFCFPSLKCYKRDWRAEESAQNRITFESVINLNYRLVSKLDAFIMQERIPSRYSRPEKDDTMRTRRLIKPTASARHELQRIIIDSRQLLRLIDYFIGSRYHCC